MTARKKPSTSDFPQRLKNLRKELEYSQRDLAREFGVSPGAVAFWESGERPVPGPVQKLVELYESSLQVPTSDPEFMGQVKGLVRRWSQILFPESKRGMTESLERDLSDSLSEMLVKTGPLGRVKLGVLHQLTRWATHSKGLAMKVVQLASYLDPSLSPHVEELLTEALAKARPVPTAKVAKVIAEELGHLPHKIFASWSPKPIAVASIGQVHLARLKTGEKVAVKVQHRGVRENLDSHLRALSAINGLVTTFLGEDTGVFEEIRKRVIEECDYELEAESQEKFREIFADDPVIVIPRVFRQYSTKKVLTTEYFEGMSFSDFEKQATQKQRNLAGEAIARFHTVGIFNHGIIYGDPHPGNFLFSGDHMAVVDFGRVSYFDTKTRHIVARLYHSLLFNDREAHFKALRESGTVRHLSKFDFDEYWTLMRAQNHHHIVDGPFRYSPEYVISIREALRKFKGKSNIRFTTEQLWAMHINGSINCLLASLRAESFWRKVSIEASHHSLPEDDELRKYR